MKAGWAIFLVIIILLVAASIGYVVFSRIRAQRLGLPPPSWTSCLPWGRSGSSSTTYGGAPPPAPGGIVGWVTDRIRLYKNRRSRTAAGAYEQPLTGRRGFGPLDPDEAWDARVGNEADAYGGYYERELGVDGSGGRTGNNNNNNNLSAAPGHTPQDGSYHMTIGTTVGPGGDDDDVGRGRTRSRSPGPMPGTRNPFGDDNERPAARNPFDNDAEGTGAGLRGLSPTPMAGSEGRDTATKDADSHAERRSIFRENI